ncbi:MAG: hypothetical protein WBA66_05060 [Xanthobacteraceae bacterium]
MAWVLRILSILAAAIAGLFVARDALNFRFIEMIVTVILIVAVVLGAAAWSILRQKRR